MEAKNINVQSKVDFAMWGIVDVTIQNIMVMDFFLLVELENIPMTFYHHNLSILPFKMKT
jgi:hypothetical protein